MNGMHWPQLSEKEKLKKQLSSVQDCCVEYEKKVETLRNSRKALKGHVTRLKRKGEVVKLRKAKK